MDPSSEPLRSGSSPGPVASDSQMGLGNANMSTCILDDNTGTGTTGTVTTRDAPIVAADPAIAATHIARFEFSDHGTKVLMVEWYPGVAALPTPADELDPIPSPNRKYASAAQTALPPRATLPSSSLLSSSSPPPSPSPSLLPVLPWGLLGAAVSDNADWIVSWPGKSTFLPARDADEDGTRRRVYFMLPLDVPVPGTITISRSGHQTLVLKPLPAIFPERFETESGPRGVLHAMWAKRRLVELEREMESELRTNAESVGLEMALAEKQWIVDNFLRPAQAPVSVAALSRSPALGRLADKLKGLRLATAPVRSAPNAMGTGTANTFTGLDNTLSPLGVDVAVPSFSAISRSNAVAAPMSAPMSLDAMLNDDGPIPHQFEVQEEDDLFALPMSPRSPDMIKSPFSMLGAPPF